MKWGMITELTCSTLIISAKWGKKLWIINKKSIIMKFLLFEKDSWREVTVIVMFLKAGTKAWNLLIRFLVLGDLKSFWSVNLRIFKTANHKVQKSLSPSKDNLIKSYWRNLEYYKRKYHSNSQGITSTIKVNVFIIRILMLLLITLLYLQR